MGRHVEERMLKPFPPVRTQRARSKDEDGRRIALMFRDAPQHAEAVEASVLVNAAVLLSMRANLGLRLRFHAGPASMPLCHAADAA
jgi:hypothetical protein